MKWIAILFVVIYLLEGILYFLLGSLGLAVHGELMGLLLVFTVVPAIVILNKYSRIGMEKHAEKDERLIAISNSAMRHGFVTMVFLMTQFFLFELATEIVISSKYTVVMPLCTGLLVYYLSYYWQKGI